MTILIILIIALLLFVIAALWYGVRTHKTVAQLESKLKAAIGDIAAYAVRQATADKSGSPAKANDS